ncbi:LOW QUALITY PROTEIN: hypothetical protein BC936DRAFT_136748 [Jimgerdemannia flammicorona]|uniref:Fanconi anaemia group A protein helical domain-containing protein n=1 Tax=Jimgerdemannia flammicorona TaxID=994334 RepID=A0A433CYW2_9FUNG|nr:LOW QUALITY PROTEIN: hypothetical protein BC936DRAFT_136748 [Jimgerdemannia flammicorona]
MISANILDHTLRKNPISLSIPTNIRTSDGLQIPTATSTAFTSTADIITILSLFAQTGRVPTSLGQDSVFRQRWYNNTFLPALLFDDHDRRMPLLPKEAVAKYEEARHGLVAALHELKKVPPKLYAQYLERRKGSGGGGGGGGGSGGGGERDGMVWLGQQKESEHFGQRLAVKENIGATESNAMEVKRQLLKKLGGLRKADVT